MKKRMWIVTSLFAVAAIAGVGIGSFYGAEDANATKKKVEIKASDKMKDHRPKEVNEKIEKAWNNAKDTFEFDDSEWSAYEYADRSHFTETLSEEENSSFEDALLSAIMKHQKLGDMMPLLLVNSDQTKAVVLFQRDGGKGKSVKIELAMKKDSSKSSSSSKEEKSKEWKVEDVEEK